MLLDSLKDFEWYNEPYDVRFTEQGMIVEPQAKTDFWQSVHHNFHKDDGHFFFTRQPRDFTLNLKWNCQGAFAFDQCGLMLRLDNLNWFKGGCLSPDLEHPQIGTIVTTNGSSDWASTPVKSLHDIWYRLKRRGSDYVFAYSDDGHNYTTLRTFSLSRPDVEVKIGAYACSPQRFGFSATLEIIEIS